jgi:coenzyme PQQ biosynthesis protein PqqD
VATPDSPSKLLPKLAKKARLRFDRHSGSYMIVYPERGLALNESAAAIAKLCDGTRTVEEIADELSKDDPSTVAEIRADVAGFVASLAEKGLLER